MKRTLFILWLCFVFVLDTKAQIVILDNEREGNSRTMNAGELPFIPTLGMTQDQFAPMSDGLLLLCGLGGTYLWRKNKKRGC